MKLTVIGTGTAAPEPQRVCSGFLVETGGPENGQRLLMDCGAGVVHAMARARVGWRDITHLLLTHFHNDHIGDVPYLFFAMKHGMRPARTEPLTVIGPKGTKKLLQKMADIFGDHLDETPFELTIDEVEPGDERRIGDTARVRVAKTKHTDGSVAYRIEAEGRSLCYTGDTGMNEELARFAQAVDLLLIECSLPDDEPMATHLTPREVAAMARIALPKRLMLTHIYPQLDRASLPEQVRLGGWPARVEIAADGDVVDI